MLMTLLVLLAAAATTQAAAAADAAATATTQAAAATQQANLPKPEIAIGVGEEEKKKVVSALVTLNGKPLQDAAVTISVQRTFGKLPLGKDTTLDDGTTVAPFPSDLPGSPDGQLRLVAEVAPTPRYGP